MNKLEAAVRGDKKMNKLEAAEAAAEAAFT